MTAAQWLDVLELALLFGACLVALDIVTGQKVSDFLMREGDP